MGGEEFMVLLPEAGDAESAIVAERIRVAVSAAPVGPQPAVTTSIGIATYPDDGDSLEALFRAADSRFYLAKHAGRNTVAGSAFPTGDGHNAAME